MNVIVFLAWTSQNEPLVIYITNILFIVLLSLLLAHIEARFLAHIELFSWLFSSLLDFM